jgi:HSP20 family protein
MFLNHFDKNRIGANLWADLDRLQEELSTAFGKGSGVNNYGSYPSVNLYQNEEEVLVTAFLPGIDTSDLEMSVVENRFLLKGNPKKESKEGLSVIREELLGSEFMRSFELPFKINSEKVTANLKNGVLAVKLPKAEDEKAKKITVKSE